MQNNILKITNMCIGKPQKKVILLMAGRLRKKELFLTFFSDIPKFQRLLSRGGGGGGGG